MKSGPIILAVMVLLAAAATGFGRSTQGAEAGTRSDIILAAAPVITPPPGTSEKPKEKIVSGSTVFFGCAIGAAAGAAALAVPPLAAWAGAAGALPAVAAVAATSGIGCTVGLFANVVITTIGWIFDRIGAAFSAIF
ncbi:MAG: hypothetical protein GC191_10265 [Azospirillum sp.]|nr:hypothetical protein [Azospirillum sp.]